MSEEIKIIDGAFSKDNPHKDIGKQKFRVRKAYTAWVEYDVVAKDKDEAIDAVIEHGGIERREWADGYHNDEPVEMYANDWNSDYQAESDDEQYGRTPRVQKIAECVPYEDNDGIYYDDPNWSTDDWEWKKKGDEPTRSKTKTEEEMPF